MCLSSKVLYDHYTPGQWPFRENDEKPWDSRFSCEVNEGLLKSWRILGYSPWYTLLRQGSGMVSQMAHVTWKTFRERRKSAALEGLPDSQTFFREKSQKLLFYVVFSSDSKPPINRSIDVFVSQTTQPGPMNPSGRVSGVSESFERKNRNGRSKMRMQRSI